MKKYLFIRTAVLAAALISGTAIYSQSSSADKIARLDYNKRNTAFAPGAISESADRSALMSIRSRSERLFINFSNAFKSATGIKVSDEKNEIHISCLVDGVLNKISYSKKGRWQYTIRYYEGTKLRKDLRNMVNDCYPRYTIFGYVAEVTVPGKCAYLVMVENETSWKRIRVVDGGVDTYEEYTKP
jgi:hypothetical protein